MCRVLILFYCVPTDPFLWTLFIFIRPTDQLIKNLKKNSLNQLFKNKQPKNNTKKIMFNIWHQNLMRLNVFGEKEG